MQRSSILRGSNAAFTGQGTTAPGAESSKFRKKESHTDECSASTLAGQLIFLPPTACTTKQCNHTLVNQKASQLSVLYPVFSELSYIIELLKQIPSIIN